MPWTQLLSPTVKNKGCSKILSDLTTLSDLITLFPQGEEEAARSCSLELFAIVLLRLLGRVCTEI